MNQFEQELAQARRKQLRLYFFSILILLLAVIIILASIIYTRGTRIDVLPEEITETAKIEVSKGLAVLTGNTLYSLFSKPVIIVSADGFYSRQQAIEDKDFGKVLPIKLKPLPANIVLLTVMTDNQTKWLVDNQLYIQSNELVHELEAGEYKITVVHPYYEVKDISLTLARGEQYEETIQLEPVNGEISIKTKPGSATLLIDGQEIDTTTYTTGVVSRD